MGVTGISFWDYAIGNLSYMFMTCSMCFIGCSLFNGVDNLNKVQDSKHSERLTRITFIIEIVMTILVMLVGGYISKGILEKKLKEQKMDQENKQNMNRQYNYLHTPLMTN